MTEYTRIIRPVGSAEADLDAAMRHLRTTRTDRNIRQINLAVDIGVTSSSLSRWEVGLDHPTIENFLDWIRLLGQRIALVDMFDNECHPIDPGDGPVKQDMLRIATILREQREQREHVTMSPDDVRKQIGVSRTQFAGYEYGERRPRPISLCRWACAVGLKVTIVPLEPA